MVITFFLSFLTTENAEMVKFLYASNSVVNVYDDMSYTLSLKFEYLKITLHNQQHTWKEH